MSVTNSMPVKPNRRELIKLHPVDLFDAWLDAENDAALMLATWHHAPRDEKGDAHAAYAAALDREAHAADLLRLRLAIA